MKKLFLITGPSGSGKTSLMKHVMKSEIVTITTRPPRPGEIEGEDYYFVTKENFENYISNGEVVEYNMYVNGHYYGITKEKLEEKLDVDDCYNIVDYNGMKRYKELYPQATTIFIYTNKQDLEKQLIIRGDDKLDRERRLLEFEKEMSFANQYDHVIENIHGRFNEVVNNLTDIINL